jgi:hypothetical protein
MQSKMKEQFRKKLFLNAFALAVILTIFAYLISPPRIAVGQPEPTSTPTTVSAHVSVSPDPASLNQAVLVTGSISPPPGSIIELVFSITKPDGTLSVIAKQSDINGVASIEYTCDQIGNWEVTVTWNRPITTTSALFPPVVSAPSIWAVQERSPTVLTASIDSIDPNPANVGDAITFRGSGTTSDGEIVGFMWTSSIDNFLSDLAEFSTSELSEGTHIISFQVQARESNNNIVWSDGTSQTLTINPLPTETAVSDGDTWQLSIYLIVFLIIALLTGIGIYFTYLVRPSLKKIEQDLLKRNSQEKTQEEKDEKDIERSKIKKKPFLKFEIKVPSRLWGSKIAKAEGEIRNVGVGSAQDVQISVAATPGLVLKKSGMNISELRPLDDPQPIDFTFVASNQIKRGNYKLRFEVKSRQTSSRVKDRSLRAIKIGLLSDNGGQKNADLLRGWFGKHEVAWDELVGADNFLKLLTYDLIVVAHESMMPPKWEKNLSHFVDASQSLLVIGKIKTPNMELISQTLGYRLMTFEDFCSVGRSLVISDIKHEATRTLTVGDEILLNGEFSICTSNIDKGQILAKQIMRRKEEGEPPKTFPAIVTNIYGEGRVIYLNFSLEQSLLQNNQILQGLFNWLIYQNTTGTLRKAD